MQSTQLLKRLQEHLNQNYPGCLNLLQVQQSAFLLPVRLLFHYLHLMVLLNLIQVYLQSQLIHYFQQIHRSLYK